MLKISQKFIQGLLRITLSSAAILPLTLAAIAENTRLPSLRGIDLSQVEYISSETSPDAKLEKAIVRSFDRINRIDVPTRYFYNRVDLNNDQKPEIIVHLVGINVCGTGGCPTLIFQTGQDYQLVSKINVTRQPIIVTQQKTNGWNDLIIFTSGGGSRPNYYLARFNGRKYPDSPYDSSRVPSNSKITGRAFIADNINSNPGIILPTVR